MLKQVLVCRVNFIMLLSSKYPCIQEFFIRKYFLVYSSFAAVQAFSIFFVSMVSRCSINWP